MWKYNRRKYWIFVAVMLLMKLTIIFAIHVEPSSLWIAGDIDTGIAAGLATAVGGRFADAGWSRWLGVGLVIMIVVTFPIIIAFPALSDIAGASNPLDAMPSLLALATVAMLALLVVAGIPRSVEADPSTKPTA